MRSCPFRCGALRVMRGLDRAVVACLWNAAFQHARCCIRSREGSCPLCFPVEATVNWQTTSCTGCWSGILASALPRSLRSGKEDRVWSVCTCLPPSHYGLEMPCYRVVAWACSILKLEYEFLRASSWHGHRIHSNTLGSLVCWTSSPECCTCRWLAWAVVLLGRLWRYRQLLRCYLQR